jgi:hypothetical protein
MRRLRIAIAILVLMALALSVTGCGALIKSAAEQATGVKVDQSGDGVTVTGPDGQTVTTGESAELPDGFPTDVPLYEGKIVSSVKTGNGFLVSLETPDEAKAIYDWYQTEVEAEGWTKTTEMSTPEGGLIAAEKAGSTLAVNVGYSASDKKSTIILTVDTSAK